jgi:hypothetical protein
MRLVYLALAAFFCLHSSNIYAQNFPYPPNPQPGNCVKFLNLPDKSCADIYGPVNLNNTCNAVCTNAPALCSVNFDRDLVVAPWYRDPMFLQVRNVMEDESGYQATSTSVVCFAYKACDCTFMVGSDTCMSNMDNPTISVLGWITHVNTDAICSF